MLRLMVLEWKKHRIGKYIRNSVIILAIMLAFIFLLAGEMEMEAAAGEAYTVGMMNNDFGDMVYIIFTGVMLSSFFMSDYEKGTIRLMFLYPISRKKILLSKIAAVWTYSFASLVITKLIIYTSLLLTKPFTGLMLPGIQFDSLAFWGELILSSASMVSISFIALWVGMKMKSSKAVIVASIVIMLLAEGNIGEFTLAGNLPFYGVLLVLAMISIYLTVRDVDKKDVM